MSPIEIATVIGTAIIGVGLALTWRKNGKSQRERDLKIAEDRAARDAALQAELQRLNRQQEVNITRTTETKNKVIEMANHCASTVATFKERTHRHEERLNKLEANKP